MLLSFRKQETLLFLTDERYKILHRILLLIPAVCYVSREQEILCHVFFFGTLFPPIHVFSGIKLPVS